VLHDPGIGAPGTHVDPIAVANFCAKPDYQRQPPGLGGYHVILDGTTVVTCAPDSAQVNGASGANADGLHLCFCDYSDQALQAAAAIVRKWCDTYALPKVRLTPAQFNARQPGIISHADVEIAIGATSPHVDPRDFPWATFVGYVNTSPTPPDTNEDESEGRVFYHPNQASNNLRPVAVAVLNGALFAFNAKANPFKQGALKPFANSHIVDLGLAPGETCIGLTDRDVTSGALRDDGLDLITNLNGAGARHVLQWA
jgi:hypothetical protein